MAGSSPRGHVGVRAGEASCRRPATVVHHGSDHEPAQPKIAVLYVTLLPQFIDPDRGSVAAQRLALGATQIVVALTVNALIVVFAGSLATFLSVRPTWLRVQRHLMGGILGALAVHLIADRTRPAT